METVNGTYLSGTDLLWRVKRDGDASFMLVACQVDLSFPLTRNVNKEDTKCGQSKNFGTLDATATINGVAMFNIDSGDNAISYKELRALIVANDEFETEISDEGGLVYASGTTKLSNLELTGDSTTNAKFSATLEFLTPDSIDFTPTT